MELWIRSQDKRELVKTNDIYIVRKDKYFHIYCYANNSEIDSGQYGDFEDKTRTLEVLDEIQKLLDTFEPKNMARMMVYEMPQE
mgnify:CR=1 FL=1